jgi:hypothetical protein
MDNETYLFKLQLEYLHHSKVYMDALREGKSISELKELAILLRSLITEIKAVREEIERGKKMTGGR